MKRYLIIATVIVMVVGAGVAVAQVDGDGTVINACAKNNNGVLRIVDGPDDCKRSEHPVSWNAEGLPGLDGADGLDGAPGPKGETGDTGERGEQGEPGAKGDTGEKGDTGADGAPGLPCTVEDNGDSTFTMTCPDGSEVSWNGVPSEPEPPEPPEYYGAVLTSDDALTWTPQRSGYPDHLRAVATNGNQWVTAGHPDAILTSDEAVTWTVQDDGSAQDFYLFDVAVAGSGAVAVGYDAALNGAITTSTDLVTWTPIQGAATERLHAIATNGSLWVAAGNHGTFLTSTDRINWISHPHSDDWEIGGIATDGAQWVAVGNEGPDALVATSPDGATWTKRNAQGHGHHLHEVATDGTQWVAVGGYGTVLTSNDAVTWAVQPSGTTTTFFDVATDGTQWVTGGSNSGIWISSDAVTWTQASDAPVSLRGVAHDGTQWVAVGSLTEWVDD